MAVGEAGTSNLRSVLIQAGVEELNTHGIEQFSVRRIATKCGVSCAAPYKHFKDKQAFLCAIISHINQQWEQFQRTAIKSCRTTREKLLLLCMAYVQFLAENPQFRSIIMQKYSGENEEFNALRSRLNTQAYALVARYCKECGVDEAVRRRKTYVFRSLIYGAALMFDNGELEYNAQNIDMVRQTMNREMDLP